MIRKMKLQQTDQNGSLLVGALLVGMLMIVLGIVLGNAVVAQLTRTNRNIAVLNALQVAEAGVERTLSELNTDDNFSGFTEEQLFFENESQGTGMFSTEVTDGADNEKIILSTGAVYPYQDTDAEPLNERLLRIVIVGTTSEGYSVHTGPGGLLLSGSASITNSDVYVNGAIEMGGASRIGTQSEPLEVNVANVRCPLGNNPGSSFPELCSFGQQPIDMAFSTRIYGTVCATHQTSTGPNNNIRGGNGGTGLVLGCVAPEVQPPTYDRQGHIDRMAIIASGNDNSYVCRNWPFNRTWPENLQLNGNVNIGGSCNIVINGDAYITGDLDIGGAATMRLADGIAESERPTIVVDGEIDLGGSAQILANDLGTGIRFISFEADAACSPDCTELTGNDLKQSQERRTVDVGGAVNLPGMIFQSYWGTARIRGSGSVGSIIGQKVDMSGAGTVVFGTSLSAGVSTWRVTGYQELPTPD